MNPRVYLKSEFNKKLNKKNIKLKKIPAIINSGYVTTTIKRLK